MYKENKLKEINSLKFYRDDRFYTAKKIKK